jgi:hypothetical protein
MHIDLIVFPWGAADAVLQSYAQPMALVSDDFAVLASLPPTIASRPPGRARALSDSLAHATLPDGVPICSDRTMRNKALRPAARTENDR